MYPLFEVSSSCAQKRTAASRLRSRGGFSLTEVITVTAILGFVSIGVMGFFLTNARYLFTSEQKLLVNADVRDITNELVENARESNYFVLYQGFSTRTRADGRVLRRDANNNGAVNVNDRCQAGEEGEFLVFVYYDDPFFDARFYDADDTNDPTISTVQVTRLVGYWIAPNRTDSSAAALYTFDSDDFRGGGSSWTTPWGATFPVTLSTSTTVESLLPPVSNPAWATDSRFRMPVNDLQGLSAEGFYFENFQNRSVFVRAKILHGNRAKRVTNTYNFTITPRG